MNELAKQFIKYLDKCEFAAKYKIGFAEMFVASLFAESHNCRISEGHQKLFLNTTRSLVVFLRIANANFQPGQSARCVSIQANGI